MEAPHGVKSLSLGPAAVGAAAGVALVALVAVGWWMGGGQADPAQAPESGRRVASVPASPTTAVQKSPHEGANSPATEDAETLRLRGELAGDPDRIKTRKELALRLLRRGNFYGAFDEANELLDRAPDDVDGLFVVAAVRVRMGQPSRALPLLEKVLDRAPEHVPALTAKGQALLKAGHDASAIETWQRALELSGGSNRQVEELMRAVELEGAENPTASS